MIDRHSIYRFTIVVAAALATTLLALLTLAVPASATKFRYESEWGVGSPQGIAVDGQSNVYVTDSSGNQVRKFTSSGRLMKSWGSLGEGDGEFYFPSGIATGPDGNVYVNDVYDAYSGRIQVFGPDGNFIRRILIADSGGPQTVTGIDLDPAGNIYAADGAASVLYRLTNAGADRGSTGALGSGPGQFFEPEGIAVDRNANVYIADTVNFRVQKLNSSGAFMGEFGEVGSAHPLAYPDAVAIGPQGNVFVLDRTLGNDGARVSEFTPTGALVSSFRPTDASGRKLSVLAPDLALDPRGNLYVADDEGKVVKYKATGPGSRNNRVKIVSKELKYKKGRIKIKARCLGSGVCKGNILVKKGRSLKLAGGSYKLAVGKTRSVVAKPTKRGGRLLRRSRKKLRVTVELNPDRGQKTIKRMKLKV